MQISIVWKSTLLLVTVKINPYCMIMIADCVRISGIWSSKAEFILERKAFSIAFSHTHYHFFRSWAFNWQTDIKMLCQEWCRSMSWKKKVQLSISYTWHMSFENALQVCFIAQQRCWVWMEMIQLTTQRWKKMPAF